MTVSRQFLIFIAGGAICALLDIGAMQLLINYGGDPFIAATAGFCLGLIANFLFHAKLTFSSTTTLTSLSRFLSVVALNYVVTIAFIFLSLSFLENALLGKIASLPVIAINGFLLSRYWVFR